MQHKLELTYDYPFELIGLVSALKEFKLAWLMNHFIKIRLQKAQDIEFNLINSDSFKISQLSFQNDQCSYKLVLNKGIVKGSASKPYLLPELHFYDYFLYVDDPTEEFEMSKLLSTLRSLPGVEYVDLVDMDNLKNKENLILE